jgi:phosphopantothenoylcysteine synthetase/decarboxylase
MRFLVTAGSTLEKIDTVRVWGNIFTGNTGLSIAKAIAQMAEVDLLTSNRAHVAELQGERTTANQIHAEAFTSHADLRDALASKMRQQTYAAIFMSAAVSDYRPAGVFAVVSRQPGATPHEQTWIVRNVQAGKVKSNHGTIAVLGEQTEKLVDLFRREWNHKGLLVKFKLEVGISPEELIRIGQASRAASGAEYLVANTLEMVDGPRAGAYLLSEKGEEWIARDQLPARMLRLLRESQGAGEKRP